MYIALPNTSLARSFQQFSFRETILTIIHKLNKMDDEVKV